MYRIDWIDELKLRTTRRPAANRILTANPVAWLLGTTSLLTDISSEIVNSVLPAYLVLYLHASPSTFGAIDGLYHGVAIALLSLAGGVLADRWRRYKELAAAGYGVSAFCKLALLAAGPALSWIAVITAIDRTGKGLRAAPRDAILSLSSSKETLTISFAIHRALDAGGTLIGPLIAFALLSNLRHPYQALWVTSFVFAVIGLAVLWLFVENPKRSVKAATEAGSSPIRTVGQNASFRRVLIAGAALATFTVSDGFVYLLVQSSNGGSAELFPLYYVITATAYMTLSIPIGSVANRIGRVPVLMLGYAVLLAVYYLLGAGLVRGNALPIVLLLLFGLYYAASEGVLMALASSVIPASHRAGGLALLVTVIGLGKMLASFSFGLLWEAHGAKVALVSFGIGMAMALCWCARTLSKVDREQSHVS